MLATPLTPDSSSSSQIRSKNSTLKHLSHFFSSPESRRKTDLTLSSFELVSATPESIFELKFPKRPVQSVPARNVSKINFRDFRCVFCEESLMDILPDEAPPVALTCSHKCHTECLLMLIDKHDMTHSIMCPTCNIETRCEDEEMEEQLIRQALLVSSDEELVEYTEFEDEELLPTTSPIISQTATTTKNEPQYQTSLEDDILHYIVSPKVSFQSEVPKIRVSNSGSHEEVVNLNCFINVQGPSYQVSPNFNKEACLKLTSEMFHKLNEEVEEWNGVDIGDLGEMICFDRLRVSYSDKSPGQETRCFLFEKILLVMSLDGLTILGTLIWPHLSSIIETENGMIELNLKTDSLPFMYLRSENAIIAKKWFHLLQVASSLNLEAGEEFQFDDNQLIQLSTNSWDLIQYNKDLIPFTKPSFKTYQMTVPKPLRLSVSFILCISLINTRSTGLSDSQYLENLQQLICNVKDSLQLSDSFGLVTIGRDPVTSEFSRAGSYIGMASPKWEEWDDIIADLQVVSSKNVFEDDYDQLVQFLKQALKLIEHNLEFKSDFKRIKKLMLVSNSYEYEDQVEEEKEYQLRELIHKVTTEAEVEINSVLVNDQSYRFQYLYFLSNSLKTIRVEEFGVIQINLTAVSFRNNSYLELVQWVPEFIAEFDDIAIPNLNITCVTEVSNDITVSSFENLTSGDFIDLNKLDQQMTFDKISVKLLNVKFTENKSFLLTLAVKKSLCLELCRQVDQGFVELTLAEIQSCWFNTLSKNEPENTSIKVSISKTEEIANPLPNEELETGSGPTIEIPLLPPLISSHRETNYIKREIELLFIRSLIESIESGDHTKLFKLVSLMFGISKSCNTNALLTAVNLEGPKEGKRQIRFGKYIEDLCHKGQEILLSGDSKLGYDLCIRVGLQ